MKTNLSLFGSSSLRGGGRVLDPICTMSLYLPFFGFDGAPKRLKVKGQLAVAGGGDHSNYIVGSTYSLYT